MKSCVDCDGSGEICDVCGAAMPSCSCLEDKQLTYSECETCEGTGAVPDVWDEEEELRI